MSERKDILFGDVDGRYDLLIENGDFVIGNSDVQHVRHIMELDEGQNRGYPLIGLGVRKMLNGPFSGEERRKISLHLRNDGYKAKRITFIDGMLKIEL